MRIPLKWLAEYVRVPKDLSLLTDRLTMAGHMLDKIDHSDDEAVIDLELRGNRADCYSIIGIAREVSALFKTSLKPLSFYHKLKKVSQLPECSLAVETPFVYRVMMVVIKNVIIGPSPKWLVQRLAAYGIPSLNNIVDATNYVMVETGEPMHAFDLDQIAPKIQIRMAKKGEEMVTFSGEKIQLTPDDLIWTKNKTPISVGGAIGGKAHSILPTTKNVLVEAASYNQANIRRTVHRHNLMTDAGIRHEKDLDPNMVPDGMYRFLELVEENNWGKIADMIFDYYPQPRKQKAISLNFDNIERIGGLNVTKAKVKDILIRLNCQIRKETKRELVVICPTYRTDLELEEDLIEEIIRVVGYDQIPTKTLSLEIPPVVTPTSINQEQILKQALTTLGFDEVISLPFVKEKNQYLNVYLQDVIRPKAVFVQNAPSPDFKDMRMNLIPNLNDFANRAVGEKSREIRMFEVGKVYYRQGPAGNYRSYVEKRKLGLVYVNGHKDGFLYFKGYLTALLEKVNLTDFLFEDYKVPVPLKSAFKITINKKMAAVGGKINSETFFAEIDLDSIISQGKPAKVLLWPKFPPIIEDVSLEVPPRTHIGPIIQIIKQTSEIVKNIELIDSYQNTKTFRLVFQKPESNLTSAEVKLIKEKFLKKLASVFRVRLKE